MVGLVRVRRTQGHAASLSSNGNYSRRGYGRRHTVNATATAFPIERSARSRISTVDFSNLPFGTLFSDHMLIAEYRDGGWSAPTIRPFAPLSLSPNISALQYGISVFEGLKAHRSPSGDILIFRPRDNARRLNRSSARLAMPHLPDDFF